MTQQLGSNKARNTPTIPETLVFPFTMDVHCVAGNTYLGRVLALGALVTALGLLGFGGRGGGDALLILVSLANG